MKKLSNITPNEFRDFLERIGCKYIRTEGGHEIWTRADLKRPIVIQTHKDPIPEFIVKNNIRLLGIDRKQFIKILQEA